ncbi:hypothetical protein A9P82_13110 [Arachidicoccus ginsenosidimutans]|nr:hypothetical protein A9P82_13110 [Arachidicoccus sp. BS20]
MFFAATSHAQSADTTAIHHAHKAWQKRSKKGNTDFYKKLNLSADQQTKLKAIKGDEKSKATAIKNNSNLSADEKKQQLKALNKDAYNKRQAIYTDEQKALIKEDHAKKKAHKGHKKEATGNGSASVD